MAHQEPKPYKYYFTVLGYGTEHPDRMPGKLESALERIGWNGVEVHDEGREDREAEEEREWEERQKNPPSRRWANLSATDYRDALLTRKA